MEQLREVSQSHASLFEKIPAVSDLQCAWLLLLFFASTTANYLLRAVPPPPSAGPPKISRHQRNAFQSCWEFKPKEQPGTLRTFLSVMEGWAGQCRFPQVSSMLGPNGQGPPPSHRRRVLHALDDQQGGIHVSASSSRDQLIRMGFLAPSWAGRRQRSSTTS